MYTTILGYAVTFIILSAVFGAILRKFFGKNNLTTKEFIVVAILNVFIGFAVFGFGYKLSKESLLTFYQNINGWEISTSRIEVSCTKNGNCKWEYDCDSYTVRVAYDCNCKTKKEGGTSCDTCYRNETRWNSCPYVKKEYTYNVVTSLGNVEVKSGVFPSNYEDNRYIPNEYRYSSDKVVPKTIVEKAGVGDPPEWVAAYNRVNSGRPGPVTIRSPYKNYLLASNSTILRERSTDIKYYSDLGLLPELRANLNWIYGTPFIGLSDRLYEVGTNLPNPQEWSEAISYLSSATGYFLQGDVILVVVNNSTVSDDPDKYTIALRAYWSDKNKFGDNSLAKNSVVVVVGTEDNKTVKWARGFSLMPNGNEVLFTKIDRLAGAEFNPKALVGETRVGYSNPMSPPFILVPSGGKIEDLLFGISDTTTKYTRSPMSFFTYLQNDIELSSGQVSIMWGISIILCVALWIIVLVFEF